MAIAPDFIFPTCQVDNVNNCDNLERAAYRRFRTYQKLLKKTKVSKHADNDKNWNILPNPDKFELTTFR